MSFAITVPVWASLNLDGPVDSFTFYTSNRLEFRTAFLSAGDVADMTGVAYCIFMLKWGSSPTGTPLMYRRVPVNPDLTFEQWQAQTSQHASMTFLANETTVDLGGLREARLLASWHLVDASNNVLAVVVQPALARVSGVEVAIPMSGFYTKAEADARYMRVLTTQFVMTNFNSLTSLDAADPAVKEVADMLCTFITTLQGSSPEVIGEWDVYNFMQRLNLNGAEYSSKEVKDLVCTLITDLKSKGVI
jgi:hypothetical protein